MTNEQFGNRALFFWGMAALCVLINLVFFFAVFPLLERLSKGLPEEVAERRLRIANAVRGLLLYLGLSAAVMAMMGFGL